MRVGVLVVGSHRLSLSASRRLRRGGPSAPSAIPGCAKASLNLVEDGQLSLATDNPAFPPWWGGGSKRRTGRSTTRRRARATSQRSRTGSPSGWASRRRRSVEAVPFQVVRAGQEAVRLLHRAGLEQARAAKAVTFSASYYVVNQAVVGLKANADLEGRRSPGSKKYKLGASSGRRATTTSSATSSPTRPRASTTRSTTS